MDVGFTRAGFKVLWAAEKTKPLVFLIQAPLEEEIPEPLEVLAEDLSEDPHQLAEQEILHLYHHHKVIQAEADTSHQVREVQEVVAEPDLQELMDVIKQEVLEETVQLLVLVDRLSQELAAEAELEVLVMLLAEALDQADLAAVEPRVLEMQVAEQVLVLRILEEAAAVAAVHHHQLTTKTQEAQEVQELLL